MTFRSSTFYTTTIDPKVKN